ncbi:MAG: M2 family metallopeptidase [Sphingomonas sp.]|uniref:M2 family metallopeptidase n=1 Tax=Sphingomonas sp. TaxID=28214 RepID=UPI003F80F9C5
MARRISSRRAAASRLAVAIIAAGSSLAIAVPLAAQTPATPPTATDARAFVADAERQLEAASTFDDVAGWIEATNITVDTDWMLQRSDAQKAALSAKIADEARRFDRTKVDPVTARKLGLLTRLGDMPAPGRAGAAEALSEVSNRLASGYATGTFTYKGRTYTLRDAEVEIGRSREPADLQAIWEGWRSVANPMRGDYARMVVLGNEGARERGYADVGDMWRSAYDMPSDKFEAQVARLWKQLAPLYDSLHTYVRTRLNQRYGDAVQPRTGPIRADLTGNMWGQDWSTIYDIVGEGLPGASGGLTASLQAKGFDGEKMVRSAEQFYISLGLQPLPQTFWERSIFVRPPGRMMDCNSSAWTVGDPGDVRLKTCFAVNQHDWITAHHELGHIYNSLAVRNQSYLFRGAANPGLSEGLGDFVALSAGTAADLKTLGLDSPAGKDADIAALMDVALGKLPLLGFAVSVDQWRWGVFAGRIKPADYNKAWWKLVETNQGLMPPRARPDDANDALAKYHLTNNVPYISYFMAYVYQFQLYRAACRMAGWKGPLHECTIRGNKTVGTRLEALMAAGRSRPADETIDAFTGDHGADASAMLEYFAPLKAWLDRQNALGAKR